MGGGALGSLVAAQKALRKHVMPFGAEVLGDGGARFRLWAPGAKQVSLLLNDREIAVPAGEGGWYEITEKARPGSLYRYRIDGGEVVPDPGSRFQPRDVGGRHRGDVLPLVADLAG